jgi:ABC-2 type transport system ATP-binding protein
MAAVRTINLTKKFDDLVAVNDLNLQIEQGEIFGFVGPDGAGKTTTLRLLTTILEPTAGQGWIFDKDVVKDSEAIKEDIAYMPQRFGLYEDLTVIENINFYADVFCVPTRERLQRIEKLLEFSNLKPFQKRLAGRLSGGMKQKLGLACALIHTPKILFLDEPTNGVDPVSRRDFWQILYQLLKDKVTIVLSTSYLEEAEYCKRVALMYQGILLKCEAPSVIKKQTNSKSMEETFLSIINDYERRVS